MALTNEVMLIAAIRNHERAIQRASRADFDEYMSICSDADDKLYQDLEDITHGCSDIACPFCGESLNEME